MRTALILGGSGFIGTALANRLVDEGTWVRVLDRERNEFETPSRAADFGIVDLRDTIPDWASIDIYGKSFDEVYQLAVDAGGAGYIYGNRHAQIMTNNVRINTTVIRHFAEVRCGRLFFASSSCVYSDTLSNPLLHGGFPLLERDAYSSTPSSGYGWEKLFSEQMYQAAKANYNLDTCIARFSTVYGPGSPFDGEKAKAVGAICRKVIDAHDDQDIEVWGDGTQARPLLYVEDLVTAIIKLVRREGLNAPVNIATKETVTCDDIARNAIELSGKRLTIKHVPGPTGKDVLMMDTGIAEANLNWIAATPFYAGLEMTYRWIEKQKQSHN